MRVVTPRSERWQRETSIAAESIHCSSAAMERGGLKQQAIPFRQKKPGTGPPVDKAEKAYSAAPTARAGGGSFEHAKPREYRR